MTRTIEEIHSAYRNGSLSPSDYVRERIADIRLRDEGGLRSFITVADPDILADQLDFDSYDRRVRRKDPFRPLEGIPIAIKDNIDTTYLGCTAGSVLLEDIPVTADAPLVTALRDAGAIVIGKNNLSEWANFRSTRSTSGWSSAGGQTRNAHAPDRSPCGSSSGGATSVAAGLVPVAIGTETDGSVICPASVQGCVGFKSTVGRVSQTGIVPISWSQDTAGPITRTVADAWVMQQVLERSAGEAIAVPSSAPPITPGNTAGSNRAGLLPADLPGLRVGVFPPGKRIHPLVDELFISAQTILCDAGAELIPIEPPPTEEIDRAERTILRYEFPIALGRYLATRRPASPYRSLVDLHRANLAHADRILSIFGQEIWDRCLPETAPTQTAYEDARATIEHLAVAGFYGRWFEREAIDVMIAPANGPAWTIDHVNGDRYTGSDTPPAAAAGNPILTVPMDRVTDLPIGLGFYGPRNGDAALFRCGLSWEMLQARPDRR